MMKSKVTSPDRSSLKSLVESIGGEAVLFKTLLKFYQLMEQDSMIGHFFVGKSIEEISRKQGEFILLAAGLRSRFEGRGPATAHTHMPPIYEGHFDRRLVLLRAVLVEAGFKESQINTWIQFEESFRALVVSKS